MTKQTMTINEQELFELLMNVERPTFTHIVSVTEPKMKKTGNPYFNGVTKKSKGNYFIGGTYQDMVNIRIGKEGFEEQFISKDCTIGVKVEGSKCLQFNENHNRHYLQYFIFSTSKIKSEYFFEGNTIDKVLLEDFLTKKSKTSRQPQEDKIEPQSFKLSSIKEISLNGTKYIIK